MAKAYVTESEDPRALSSYTIPVMRDDGSGSTFDQTPIDFTAGHAESAAFGANTKFIRINVDAVCSFTIGKTPSATTSNRRLSAGQTEYWSVLPGTKISFISNT